MGCLPSVYHVDVCAGFYPCGVKVLYHSEEWEVMWNVGMGCFPSVYHVDGCGVFSRHWIETNGMYLSSLVMPIRPGVSDSSLDRGISS